LVAFGELGVEPPAKTAVKTLCAIEVGNRDDDNLELEVGPAHLSTAHVWLLRFKIGESGADNARRPSNRLAERSERCSELCTEELRLFPRGEVSALVDLVEV